MKRMLIALAAAPILWACSSENDLMTAAPEGNLSVVVNADKSGFAPASFSLMAGKDTLMANTRLGITTSAKSFENLRLVSTSPVQNTTEDYNMVTGKRVHCVNTSADRTYSFVNEAGDSLNVQFRVFPDGVAFRYQIPSAAEGEMVGEELTTYSIPNGTRRWMQSYDIGYERFFPLATDGSDVWKHQDHKWGYPGLVEPKDSLFVLITESDITRGHAASLLSNAADTTAYQVVYGGEQSLTSNWTSPWRVLIAGGLDTVVESTLVTDVATPSATPIDELGWIRPAPVSWIYWAYNHGSNDLNIIKEYIDLAAEMKWPYMLIDAEWDEMKDGHKVEEAFEYAHQKHVKPMIWYNSCTGWIDGAPGPKWRLNKREDRLKEFEWLRQNGVKGVKIDFFGGDDVLNMDYSIDLLEDAMANGLTVTFHGATVPRGWQRTHPNLMTTEGVYGAEWYNNNGYLTDRAAKHNATLPFTRNVIGSMDYTPGTFTDSQNPHITSHGHELALPILFESGMQHMPDRPSSYLSMPDKVKALLSTLPTAWDDTKLLAGYPGEYVVMARRYGDTWYVAGINGTDAPMDITADLSRLGLGDCNITLFPDGNEQFAFGEITTKHLDDKTLTVTCRERGGFVAVIEPTDNAQANAFGNALVPDMIADASIVQFGDTFYCYATTDGYGQGLATSGPPVVWKSRDFVNWVMDGTYFPSAAKEKYWAPSKAVAANGKYYIYPTVNHYMYAAVADSPEGPFA